MEKHRLADKTVILKVKIDDMDHLNGQEFTVEDWWINISGSSWMNANGNPAALKYAMRGGVSGLPIDDNVVYGKVGPFGHLIHESELGEVVEL